MKYSSLIMPRIKDGTHQLMLNKDLKNDIKMQIENGIDNEFIKNIEEWFSFYVLNKPNSINFIKINDSQYLKKGYVMLKNFDNYNEVKFPIKLNDVFELRETDKTMYALIIRSLNKTIYFEEK